MLNGHPVPATEIAALAKRVPLIDILQALTLPQTERTVCPHCQFTLEEVLETGFLGCPLCYEVFADSIPKRTDG